MKLYFSPGACSLATHIILQEANLEYLLEKVDLRTKKTDTGADYGAINPKGYVPMLQLDDGRFLTEGVAIVQYLADLVPEKKLAPAAGTMERYRLMETLSFISTELHKNFSPLFNPGISDAGRDAAIRLLRSRFAVMARQLSDADFLGRNQFTVADAYLFVLLLWTDKVKFPLQDFPSLMAFRERVAARPTVQAAMKLEGLLPA